MLIARPVLADAACRDLQTQPDINACIASEYAVADRQINSVYPQVRAALSVEEHEGLKMAQRAWLAWRDADCEFEGFLACGGSMEPMSINSCRTGKATVRVRWLLKLADETR